MVKKNLFRGNILVIGLGSIGERHVRNLIKCGVTDISVLRRSDKKPRTISDSKFKTFFDLKSALKLKPEAAIIATPSSMHTIYLDKLIKNGIPTLIEVPISNSLKNLNRINNDAKKNKVPILVGHNLKFHPALKSIKKLVQSNSLGKIFFSRSQFGEHLPDNHIWDNFKNRYEARADLGGGVILTSIHEIDHAVWLFGKVKSVNCITKKSKFNLDVEDFAIIILEHKSGITSEIQLDFISRAYVRSLQICGEKSYIDWIFKSNKVKFYNSQRKKWQVVTKTKKSDVDQSYIEELKHFSDIIYNNVKPLTSFESSLHVLDVALMSLKSGVNGKQIIIKS